MTAASPHRRRMTAEPTPTASPGAASLGGATPRRPTADVWLSEPHDPLAEWHLLDGVRGVQGLTRCGRSARLISSKIWPVRPGEPGPAPASACAECTDLIIREDGRLPLA
jgi:hypothetical protein